MTRTQRLRLPTSVLLVLYTATVLAVVFRATPVDSGSRGFIDRVLDLLHRQGLPSGFGYDELEFGANIAMFVPLGLLIAVVLGRRLWWVSGLICVVLSVIIETVQLLALPDRFATVRDVVANSCGGVLGTLLAGLLLALLTRHRRRNEPASTTQ